MRRLSLTMTLLLALGLAAQQPEREQKTPTGPQEEFRLRVAVEIVTAPLVVRDARGEYIYDLTRSEIQILDNGVPQQITNFELAEQPISLVILLDTSQTVKPLLDRLRQSGILFTSYIMGQFGEAAVVTFDSEVMLRQEFTSDVDEITKAVARIQPGGNETRLADALDLAVNLLLARSQDRRPVIVAVSEPRNNGSAIPIGEPLRLAQLAGISIYTVALSRVQADLLRRPEDTPVRDSPYPPGVFPRPPLPGQPETPCTEAQRQHARVDLGRAIEALVRTTQGSVKGNVLEVYAQGTGGLSYRPFSRGTFEQAINLIGQDLHNQYLVSYRPSNRSQRGFHRIQIRVSRRGVSIRTRPGYYVGPPQ
ncbi:MAG: VWA domain-containing protein [Acidobacteria bacterium]|nr:VWA domain-containing protein [Acidobacteriota bacterium]